LKRIRDYYKADKVNRFILISSRENVLIDWRPSMEGWVKLNTNDSYNDIGEAECVVVWCDMRE